MQEVRQGCSENMDAHRFEERDIRETGECQACRDARDWRNATRMHNNGELEKAMLKIENHRQGHNRQSCGDHVCTAVAISTT